jgi:hypothetical protein
MKDPVFSIGQKVKIVPFSGHDPEVDRLLGALAGKRGAVEKYYCIGREEMPDRIKSFVYPEYAYSYDILLDDGEILRGIPEVALAPDAMRRK